MQDETRDPQIDEVKAELDALEAAFAKKSAPNSRVVNKVRTGVRAGGTAQPLSGVIPPHHHRPPPIQPMYGAIS